MAGYDWDWSGNPAARPRQPPAEKGQSHLQQSCDEGDGPSLMRLDGGTSLCFRDKRTIRNLTEARKARGRQFPRVFHFRYHFADRTIVGYGEGTRPWSSAGSELDLVSLGQGISQTHDEWSR